MDHDLCNDLLDRISEYSDQAEHVANAVKGQITSDNASALSDACTGMNISESLFIVRTFGCCMPDAGLANVSPQRLARLMGYAALVATPIVRLMDHTEFTGRECYALTVAAADWNQIDFALDHKTAGPLELADDAMRHSRIAGSVVSFAITGIVAAGDEQKFVWLGENLEGIIDHWLIIRARGCTDRDYIEQIISRASDRGVRPLLAGVL